MHVYTIDDKKVAIFWSPRCGHRSTHHLLRSWGYLHLGLTAQVWKTDLPAWDWEIDGEHVHRDFCKQVTVESLEGYVKLVIFRDPWKRFCSFWRWRSKCINTIDDVTPEKFIANYDRTRQDHDVEHHSMPQWSQASCLLDGSEEYFDIINYDYFAVRLAELTGNVCVKDAKIAPDTWDGTEGTLVRPPNFSDLYGADEEAYKKIKG